MLLVRKADLLSYYLHASRSVITSSLGKQVIPGGGSLSRSTKTYELALVHSCTEKTYKVLYEFVLLRFRLTWTKEKRKKKWEKHTPKRGDWCYFIKRVAV